MIFHLYFSVEFIIRLYGSKDRLGYLVSTEGIIDIVSNCGYFLLMCFNENFLVVEDNFTSRLGYFCLCFNFFY